MGIKAVFEPAGEGGFMVYVPLILQEFQSICTFCCSEFKELRSQIFISKKKWLPL